MSDGYRLTPYRSRRPLTDCRMLVVFLQSVCRCLACRDWESYFLPLPCWLRRWFGRYKPVFWGVGSKQAVRRQRICEHLRVTVGREMISLSWVGIRQSTRSTSGPLTGLAPAGQVEPWWYTLHTLITHSFTCWLYLFLNTASTDTSQTVYLRPL
jgi:hypothetical protein